VTVIAQVPGHEDRESPDGGFLWTRLRLDSCLGLARQVRGSEVALERKSSLHFLNSYRGCGHVMVVRASGPWEWGRRLEGRLGGQLIMGGGVGLAGGKRVG